MSRSSLSSARLVSNYIATCLRIEEMHEAAARGEDVADLLARTNALAEEMEAMIEGVRPESIVGGSN